MHVKIIISKSSEYILQKVIRNLNDIQTKFIFNYEIDDIESSVLNSKKEIVYESFVKRYSNNSKTIFITENKIDDNWFSHNESELALISYNGWNDLFSPQAYMIF